MSALASLGKAYDALEEREKAIEFYELALKIARDLDDVRAERQTLMHLNNARNPQAKAAKNDKSAKSGSSKTKARKAAKKKASSSGGTRRKASRKKSARQDTTSPEDQPGSLSSDKEN